jgi:cytochrome c oxidase subunit II
MRTEAPEDAIVIELYSKQFDWTARYAGNDNALGRASIHLIDGANFLGLDSSDTKSADDIIVKTEFHLPVNRPVHFLMRSQDVIHSAYMPHFRAQMNTLPGMTTQFIFTPTITTEEMRKETGNSEFNYILLCNKICGASHFNMQMNIVVEEEEAYNKWLSEQTKFMQPASTDIGSEEKDNKLSVLNNN